MFRIEKYVSDLKLPNTEQTNKAMGTVLGETYAHAFQAGIKFAESNRTESFANEAIAKSLDFMLEDV